MRNRIQVQESMTERQLGSLRERIKELENLLERSMMSERSRLELERKYEETIDNLDFLSRELCGIRSMMDLSELILDKDWHVVGFSPDFPGLTQNVYSYANNREHVKKLIGEWSFGRISNYLDSVRELEDLPYDEGEPWNLVFEGPGSAESLDKAWVKSCISKRCRWEIKKIDGRNCIYHPPHQGDNVDCYLMSKEQYGGAAEDLRVVYRVKTAQTAENIRDLSLVLSGASGWEGTNPDYIGYTVCTGASNRYARIQKYCTNLFLRPETLLPDTEYEITVERVGGRISRELKNLYTGESATPMSVIDSQAVYGGQNHVGLATFSGEALFYDIKIYTRKSRFSIDRFRIAFDFEVEIDDENLRGRIFRLRISRHESLFMPLNILVLEDITNRKEAERALLASEEKYRALFEESKDALCVIGRDGRFIEANPAMLKLFGYSMSEILRLDLCTVFLDPAEQRAFLSEVKKRGSVRDYAVKLKKNNGTEMDCLCNSTVRLDRDDRIWGFQTTITDITERKRLVRKERPFFSTRTAMKRILELASLAGENDTPVTLTGETGTGKGVLAQWIHEHSRRNSGAFVEINCSCLKGEMLASELFGHARGAFTSAVQERKGLIQLADGGTLFLDEIGNMSLGVQAEFLKVIEEREYRRLGEDQVRHSDFRLICSTNMDLFELARSGAFRQDLFFRINVFPIHIPPLRKRMEDFEDLVQHILTNLRAPHMEMNAEVMTLLRRYSWPGNVRELRNVLERALLLSRGCKLVTKDFPGLDSKPSPVSRGELQLDIRATERRRIQETIRSLGGDKSKAARVLGISRATLYRKLK